MEKPEMEQKENVTNEEKPTVDVDAVMKRLEQLESTNQRILDESKQWKSKYQGLKSDVEKNEAKKLEESENWKDLFEIEKNKSHELNEQIKHFKKETLKQKVHFEVAKHAPDAFDINDVISNLPRDILVIDEDALTVKGIEEAVSLVKEKKPYMFNNKKVHGQASSRPVGENSRSSYDELSKKEKDDLFIKALSNF
jgi:hypothetical protein